MKVKTNADVASARGRLVRSSYLYAEVSRDQSYIVLAKGGRHACVSSAEKFRSSCTSAISEHSQKWLCHYTAPLVSRHRSASRDVAIACCRRLGPRVFL